MLVGSRSLFVSVVVLGLCAAACGPARPTPTGGGSGGSGGSAAGGGTGGGAAGGGTGGSAGGGSGGGSGGGAAGGGSGGGGSSFSYDGGTTISAVKGAPFCSDRVTVNNVVVTAMANSFRGNLGDYGMQYWVADPNNLKDGLFVDKFVSDVTSPGMLELKPGNIVKMEGYMFRQSNFVDRIARRTTLKSQFNCRQPDGGFYSPSGAFNLTLVDAGTGMAPTPLTAPAGFGNAMMGNARPNPDYAGVRVTIPGPIAITNPNPPAFKRVSQITTDDTYFGFEVTGGVLVNNFNTFDRTENDGGLTVRCDWRKMMLDGGSVTFPNGITGVWDTYAHASCEDGGTSCSGTNDRRNTATIPGAVPPNDFTYVLYPVDCTELQGVYDAGM